jgi:DNA-binding SARP family transcriptional activator
MTALRLALLGPPVVLRDGLPVTFDTRKAVALLALLAVTGREHSREQLADLLWPEADSAKGRASLRRTLSVTAAAMGAGLTISRAAVTLELGAVEVDVREFEALITRSDAESLERAVQLYRDDFLSGFVLRSCPDFEEWQWSVAEGLRQALARGLQRLVAACMAEGDLERATGHARRLQLFPARPAHQAIIRLHGWAYQRSAAMRRTGRWSGCWTGTRPFGRCPRRLGCTTTCGRAAGPPPPSAVRREAPPAAPATRRVRAGLRRSRLPRCWRSRDLAVGRTGGRTGHAPRGLAGNRHGGPGGGDRWAGRQRENAADHRVPD